MVLQGPARPGMTLKPRLIAPRKWCGSYSNHTGMTGLFGLLVAIFVFPGQPLRADASGCQSTQCVNLVLDGQTWLARIPS